MAFPDSSAQVWSSGHSDAVSALTFRVKWKLSLWEWSYGPALTSALDWSESSAVRSGRLNPRDEPPASTGWAPQPVWLPYWIQSDSKRWTQLKSKRRLNTCQTVVCGIPSSLLTLRADLSGLRSKLSWIRLTFSSDTRKTLCCIVAILLSTDAAAWLCARRAL